MLLLLKALILGIVEGATEFLPVSSTGHLIIVSSFLDYPEAQRAMFEIFIQLGAILAVVWHFRADLLDLAGRLPRQAEAQSFVGKVLLAFLPAAAVGFLFHHAIEEHLFHPRVVAAALIAGGLVLLLIESRKRVVRVEQMERLTWRDAMWVGIAQVASLFPGVSRAGATIVGGMLAGLSRSAATQFSFYLALPTVSAASLFSLLKNLSSLTAGDVAPLTVGFLSAFVSALLVIRVFLAYVQTHDFRAFGYYRIFVGLLVLVLV